VFLTNKDLGTLPPVKAILANFKTSGTKAEKELSKVQDKVPEDQTHEIEILKFNLKNLLQDLTTT